MIKGCSKRVIVLKDTGSECFEEAYFILKPHNSDKGRYKTDGEFLEEAQRVIKSNLCSAENTMKKGSGFCFGKKDKKRAVRLFVFALCVSLSTFTLLYFLGLLNI